MAFKSEKQKLMKEKEGLDEKAGLVNETRLLADFRSENLLNCNLSVENRKLD